MSETPTTYDCGVTCSCDAVTELASERTELMEEMAAAIESASTMLRIVQRWQGREISAIIVLGCEAPLMLCRAVLAKYRGEERDSG